MVIMFWQTEGVGGSRHRNLG